MVSDEIFIDERILDQRNETNLNDLKQMLIDLHAKIDEKTSSVHLLKQLEENFDKFCLKMEKKVLPEIAKPSDISFDDERIAKLYSCRSIDDLLKEFTELSYSRIDGHFNCNLCSPLVHESALPIQGKCTPGIFHYSADEGESFDSNAHLPDSFRNLKKHLKVHFTTSIHIQNWSLWDKKEKEK